MIDEAKISPEALKERAKETYEQKTAPERSKERQLTQEEQSAKEKIAETAQAPASPQVNDAVKQAVNELLTLDEQAQLSELVSLVFTKDVVFAVKVARGLENPLVLDTFHDLLARDDLFSKLVNDQKL